MLGSVRPCSTPAAGRRIVTSVTERTHLRVKFPLLPIALLSGVLLLLPGGALPIEVALAQQPQAESEQGVERGLARGKKLVLKDGSFQLVRDYEQRGERVRFYSVERSAWEEIPAALVDWEATRHAEEEEAERQQQIRERIRELRAEELAVSLDVDASLELAPGVFLPEGHGIFVFEEGGIRPLEQSLAETRVDKGHVLTQILVPVPLGSRHRVEVPGARSGFRVRTSTPEFYMRTVDQREPEVELVRTAVRRNSRRLEFVNTDIAGQRWGERQAIPVQRWQIARGVYRFTPSESLEPGEYALVELVAGEGMNLYVWDFGVDASAGASGGGKK
jgi:hypothetical protein